MAAAVAVVLTACGGGSSSPSGPSSPAAPTPAEPTRSFWMGFTTWPYDATAAAVSWTWQTLRTEGDLVAHHVEQGVPWAQAEQGVGAAYPASFQAELDAQRAQSSGRRRLLSINALSQGRDGLALSRGERENQPLASDWQGLAFDDSRVKAAFASYALRMVAELPPDVLLTGIEVNLLARNQPARWASFVALQCHVYAAVKARHPALPVGVSVFAMGLLPEWSPDFDLASQQRALADLAPCVDVVAWSVYPFMSALLADSLPADFLSRAVARLPAALASKPMGISESGYPAQRFSQGSLTWNGTPAAQASMLVAMLDEAERQRFGFVVWYSARDYDALWTSALAQDPVALLWRDTGLFDEAGTPRPAIETWRAWRARSRRP